MEARKASLHTAISYSLVVIPFLIFLFLLANKLDAANPMLHPIIQFNFMSSASLNNFHQMSYFTVCIPLYFTFIILICLSFGSKGNNSWWFGIRRDFGTFLLSACPCLREYANISYNKQNQINNGSPSVSDSDQAQLESNMKEVDDLKYKLKLQQPKTNLPVVPHMTLDAPD